MKKIKLILFILFISITLVACNLNKDANSNLDKEQVIEKTEESFKELKSLNEEVDMVLSGLVEGQQQKQSIEMEVEMIYDDNKDIESIHTKTEVTSNNQTQTMDFYKNPENMYINQGNGWIKFNGQEDYSTTYEPILDSFLTVVEDLDMEEKEEKYIFKYKGKDAKIYRLMGVPYNIEYNGIDNKDIELDLEYSISKENMLLNEIKIKTFGEIDEQNNIEINVDVDFDDFNEIDEIEIPEEVTNSASIK